MKLINRSLNYLRDRPTLFIVIFVILFILLGILIRLLTPPIPRPPKEQVSFRGIYPGFSTPKDVVAKLGQPLKTSDWENQNILNYDVPASNWNDQIFTQNDQVVLVRELVTSPTLKSAFTKQYGDPEAIYYGPLSTAGQHLYAYLSNGVAVIAPEFADAVSEIWYFAPTDAATFAVLIRPHGYTTTRPEFVE